MSSVNQVIKAFQAIALRQPGSMIFPEFVAKARGHEAVRQAQRATAADLGVAFFNRHNMNADRAFAVTSRGYPARLRELASPPWWDEDSEGDVPLLELIETLGPEHLIREYTQTLRSMSFWRRAGRMMDGLAERSPLKEDDEIGQRFGAEELQDTLRLAQALGRRGFQCLWNALFPWDEFTLAPGAPDLLVWAREPGSSLWFLVEVKAPGDCLRPTQITWLQEHWGVAEDHFAVFRYH